MSLVGTLAKVAVGVVVAKGLGSAISHAGDRPEAEPGRGGSLGRGTPYGRPASSPRGTPSGDDLPDVLGQILGRQGARGRGSLGSALEELSELSRPGPSHPRTAGGDHRFEAPRPGSLGDVLDKSLRRYGEPDIRPSQSDEAMAGLLLRALIQAAKSDGRIDRYEKEQLVEKLGDLERSDIDFVNQELVKSIDVAGLARDVPRGAEAQVYMMSLMGIDLDTRQEASYLHDLARALRLDSSTVNAIHDRLGEPRLTR